MIASYSNTFIHLFTMRIKCYMCYSSSIPSFFYLPVRLYADILFPTLIPQYITTTGFTRLMSISLSLYVGGLLPQIHCIEWTCAHFNTFTKLSIIFKANWHSLTQTHTITIDRLLSSHLKNMLLMGEWGTWNHFQWDIKAALWGGLVVITPHRPVLKEAI